MASVYDFASAVAGGSVSNDASNGDAKKPLSERDVGDLINEAMSLAENTAAYMKALYRCPEVVREESPYSLYYNFYEQNQWRAAEHLAAYWSFRVKFFGDRAFRPIDEALDEEAKEWLYTGVNNYLPTTREGRSVYYLDRSRVDRSAPVLPLEPRMQACWWVLHQISSEALKRQEKEGTTGRDIELLLLCRLHFRAFDKSALDSFHDLIFKCFCFKIPEMHICVECPTKAAKRVYHEKIIPMGVQRAGGKYNNLRRFDHCGDKDELMYELITNGFDVEGIPDNLGGTFRLEKDWRECLFKHRLIPQSVIQKLLFEKFNGEDITKSIEEKEELAARKEQEKARKKAEAESEAAEKEEQSLQKEARKEVGTQENDWQEGNVKEHQVPAPQCSRIAMSTLAPQVPRVATSMLSPQFPGIAKSRLSPLDPGVARSSLSPQIPEAAKSNLSKSEDAAVAEKEWEMQLHQKTGESEPSPSFLRNEPQLPYKKRKYQGSEACPGFAEMEGGNNDSKTKGKCNNTNGKNNNFAIETHGGDSEDEDEEDANPDQEGNPDDNIKRKNRRKQQNVIYSRRKRQKQKRFRQTIKEQMQCTLEENLRLKQEGERLERLIQEAEKVVQQESCKRTKPGFPFPYQVINGSANTNPSEILIRNDQFPAMRSEQFPPVRNEPFPAVRSEQFPALMPTSANMIARVSPLLAQTGHGSLQSRQVPYGFSMATVPGISPTGISGNNNIHVLLSRKDASRIQQLSEIQYNTGAAAASIGASHFPTMLNRQQFDFIPNNGVRPHQTHQGFNTTATNLQAMQRNSLQMAALYNNNLSPAAPRPAFNSLHLGDFQSQN